MKKIFTTSNSQIFFALMVTILTAFALIVWNTAFAFKPRDTDFGHTCITESVLKENHPGCPGVAAASGNRFFVTLSERAGGLKAYFSQDAIDDIVRGVQSNDWLVDDISTNPELAGGAITPDVPENPYRGDSYNANAHCDDEQIDGCRALIVQRREYALQELVASYMAHKNLKDDEAYKRIRHARMWIGKSLHTIQDFYAHSNYAEVNSNSDGYYAALTGTNLITSNQKSPVNFCYSREFNPLNAVINFFGIDLFKNFTRANNPGNWELLPNNLYTTGYFTLFRSGLGKDADATDVATQDIGGARCDHGFDGLIPGLAHISGINKDALGVVLKPGPDVPSNGIDYHSKASRHAALHTREFIKSVEVKVGELAADTTRIPRDSNQSVADIKDILLQLLLGRDPEIVFVVDRSGSMDDIMSDVKLQLDAIEPVILNRCANVGPATPCVPFPLVMYYKLLSYSEKLVSGTWVPDITFDAGNGFFGGADNGLFAGATLSVMKQAVSQLVLRGGTGGGDCPEPSMQALLKAIEVSPKNSRIYLFTDASAKDIDKAPEVLRQAAAKNILITFSVSGSCSPISPAYHQIAAATGGQVLVVDHGAGGAGPAFAAVGGGGTTGQGSYQPIHIEKGSLSAGATKAVLIPVENGATQLAINVTNDSSGIAIRDPNGVLQTLTPFLGGSSLKVSTPTVGNWTVGLSGWPTNPPGAPASAYVVNAQAVGAFELLNASYSSSTLIGRPGHEYNRAYGPMPPATDVRLTAQLKTNAPSNPSTYKWEAIAEDGTVLGPLNLSRKTPDQYEGTAALQSISAGATKAWRIRASGTDNAGQPFARVLPALHNAKRYTFDIIDTPSHWLPGAINKVKVRIDNYTTNDTFAIGAAPTIGSIASTSPTVNQIAPGDYATFDINVQLPANAPVNSAQSLNIALVSQLAGNTNVLDNVRIPIAIELDSDGDGVPDRLEMGSVGVDPNYDGNGDGTPDRLQANVISFPSNQKRAYLTAELTNGSFKLARALPAEGLAQLKYTIDLIDFKITGLAAGAATQMKLQLPGYMTASGYGKFGPVPGNATAAWYDFNYDAATGLGAKVDKNIVTLYLKDGAKGDDDLTANGEIIDIGGPVGVQIAGVGTASTPGTTTIVPGTTGTTTTTTSTPSGSTATTGTGNPDGSGTNAPGANPFSGSSGGGGCTVGDPTNPHPDDSLWLLLLAALAVLGARTSQAVQLRQRHRR